MKISYDEDVQALSIQIAEGDVKETVELCQYSVKPQLSSRSAANGPLSLDGCAIAYEGSLAADPQIGKTPVATGLLVLRDQRRRC